MDRQRHNDEVIARWEARWQAGPPDEDDRDDDEVARDEAEQCRREDALVDKVREAKDEAQER